jgi:Protein of unknown function (DUF2748)
MTSIYHILDKIPSIDEQDMQIEYENLAKKLVNSGRMRIDTDYYCNFSRFSDPSSGITIMMTKEELSDINLLKKTRQVIKNLYSKKNKTITDKQIDSIITELLNQTKKLFTVPSETQIRLARIFVQSAHPIVIKWLLLDRTQIFITYSHNIGDVMDISSWKTSGTNSGMQSTDGSNVCIYVSCGGDPFSPNNKNNPVYGDGFAAVARLQIIAGQEIGHYADIMRDAQGRQIGRHSANFSCTRAKPHVKQGRRNDIERCQKLYKNLLSWGMDKILFLEEQLKFYDKQKISGLKVLWIKISIKYHKRKLLRLALNHHCIFIKRFSKEKYMGIMIKAMIFDMQSNLSPVADVYKRSDPEAEEAIACVEALARVPQQVMKWGYLTTKATMHDLYKIYYSEVIPSLIKNYELHTNTKYKRNYNLYKPTILQVILAKLNLQKNKFKFTPVRDV